jgi:hypothetical protein
MVSIPQVPHGIDQSQLPAAPADSAPLQLSKLIRKGAFVLQVAGHQIEFWQIGLTVRFQGRLQGYEARSKTFVLSDAKAALVEECLTGTQKVVEDADGLAAG